MSETCCPYCDTVCDDESHNPAAVTNSAEYYEISRKPDWIRKDLWGGVIDLGTLVITAKKPSNTTINKIADSNLPVYIDNVPYADNLESAYYAPHPINQSIDAAGDAASLAQSAVANPHQAFLAEAEKFKNSASLKHDLASGFSQTIIEFEQGHIYDERRAYYAGNREALNEAVEKIRTDAAELTQKHGEAVGKAYLLGGIAKITGTLGNLADAYELGDRISKASENGNWDPVAAQVAKIAASAAAVSASTTLARGLGAALMLAGFSAGVVTAATIGAGIALTIVALNVLDDLDKEISNANRFDFGNTYAENTDLVVFGNHSHSGDTKLAATSVTLIGSHRFENLEIDSEDLAVIGDIDSNGKLILNAENTHISNGREIAADFPQSVSEKTSENPEGENGAEAAAETPVEIPVETPVETPATAAEAAIQIPGLLEEAGFDWDNAETGPQGQAHYQPPTGLPGLSLSEEPVLPENPAYPDILQPEIQTPIQENPII